MDNIKEFNNVWDRVVKERNNDGSKFEGETTRLRRFMDYEAESITAYQSLAQRSTSRRYTGVFQSIARDEQNHLRNLQSAYFLLTGDSYRSDRRPASNQGMLAQLRSQYQKELESAKAYEQASERTRIPNLAEIFKSNSKDEARHAKILENMIRQVMR